MIVGPSTILLQPHVGRFHASDQGGSISSCVTSVHSDLARYPSKIYLAHKKNNYHHDHHHLLDTNSYIFAHTPLPPAAAHD